MGMAAMLVFWPKQFELTSIPNSMEAPHEIWLKFKRLLRIRSLKILNVSDYDQGQWMTLTFGTHKYSYTHLIDFVYQLWYHKLQKFLRNQLFNFFPYKSIRDSIWPFRKIGQGPHRVIIWINFVILEYL